MLNAAVDLLNRMLKTADDEAVDSGAGDHFYPDDTELIVQGSSGHWPVVCTLGEIRKALRAETSLLRPDWHGKADYFGKQFWNAIHGRWQPEKPSPLAFASLYETAESRRRAGAAAGGEGKR